MEIFTKLKNYINSHPLRVLMLIFLVGLILKLINFWDYQIFSYDQARDAQRMAEIIGGHIKIVGPETDIRGLFNGPLFYYLLAPVYLISKFNPNVVGLFMVLVNLSGVFILYYLCVVLFKNRNIGLISAFFWAISYEQANFARYISNASFMPICALLFFLGLAMYFVKQNKWGIYISVIGLGTAIHFNVYLAYLVILYPILYLVYKPKIFKKEILLGLLGFTFILSPFVLAELKWNFMATKALLTYFFNHSKEGGSSFLTNLNSYPARITGALYYGFFSFNRLLSIFLLGGAIAYLIKVFKYRKSLLFLLIWFFSTLPLFFFKSGVLTTEVINTSIFGAITIIFACVVYELLKTKVWILGILIFVIVVISNLSLFISYGFKPYNIFALQTLLLKDEKMAIDYTYKTSNGKFSVCALTNPLTINTLWSFLYKYYGEDKFKYLPNWSGKKQDIHVSYLPYDQEHLSTRYLIIEPLGGIPEFTKWATIYEEDKVSILVEQKNFGDIIVQKRKLDFNKGDPRDTQHLSAEYLKRTLSLLSYDQSYSCYNNY